jgi:mRNA interferase MazF
VATPDPRRGELWWVDWSPGRGSEQAGRRPALIVQTDPANRNPRYPNTIVATVSISGRHVPSHVRIEPDAQNGLSTASFVKCEQLMTISKERLETRLGRLRSEDLDDVGAAMRIVLAL